MNIYEFIDSKAIREHLNGIDYKYTSLEASYIVWQSKKHSAVEKYSVWEYIMQNMSDFKLTGWNENFFELLSKYIEIDKEIIKMKIPSSKCRSILCENDYHIYKIFYSLYINIPTPFRKGDILATNDGKPFIFMPRHTVKTNDAEKGWYDMCPRGYMLIEGKNTIEIRLMEETYLTFDYYKQELKEKERILKLLSDYYKNRFDPVILLNTYTSLTECNAKGLQSWSWIHNVDLNDVNLSDIFELFPDCEKESTQLPF